MADKYWFFWYQSGVRLGPLCPPPPPGTGTGPTQGRGWQMVCDNDDHAITVTTRTTTIITINNIQITNNNNITRNPKVLRVVLPLCIIYKYLSIYLCVCAIAAMVKCLKHWIQTRVLPSCSPPRQLQNAYAPTAGWI